LPTCFETHSGIIHIPIKQEMLKPDQYLICLGKLNTGLSIGEDIINGSISFYGKVDEIYEDNDDFKSDFFKTKFRGSRIDFDENGNRYYFVEVADNFDSFVEIFVNMSFGGVEELESVKYE
jgi:hypothetical protein